MKHYLSIFFFCLVCITKAGYARSFPPITKVILENKLEVLFIKENTAPLVSFHLLLPSGYLYEKEKKEGTASLAAQMLELGNKDYDADTIANTLEENGARFSVGVEAEYSLISSVFLKSSSDTILPLLRDIVLFPTFPKKELKRLKKQELASLKEAQETVPYITSIHAMQMLFGSEHRMGKTRTEKSIKNISPEDLHIFHKQYYSPNGAILLIVGDIDIANMQNTITSLFKEWNTPAQPKKYVPVPQLTQEHHRFVHKPGLTQATIQWSSQGIPLRDKDLPAFILFNDVLGGSGFSSRLMKKLRSEIGNTYGIYSYPVFFHDSTILHINTFTRNAELTQTTDSIAQVLTSSVEKGITNAELAHAKSYYQGSLNLRLESPANLGSFIIKFRQKGLSLEEIRSFFGRLQGVSQKDMVRLLKRLRKQPFQKLIVGDKAAFKDHVEVGAIEDVRGYKEAL